MILLKLTRFRDAISQFLCPPPFGRGHEWAEFYNDVTQGMSFVCKKCGKII